MDADTGWRTNLKDGTHHHDDGNDDSQLPLPTRRFTRRQHQHEHHQHRRSRTLLAAGRRFLPLSRVCGPPRLVYGTTGDDLSSETTFDDEGRDRSVLFEKDVRIRGASARRWDTNYHQRYRHHYHHYRRHHHYHHHHHHHHHHYDGHRLHVVSHAAAAVAVAVIVTSSSSSSSSSSSCSGSTREGHDTLPGRPESRLHHSLLPLPPPFPALSSSLPSHLLAHCDVTGMESGIDPRVRPPRPPSSLPLFLSFSLPNPSTDRVENI